MNTDWKQALASLNLPQKPEAEPQLTPDTSASHEIRLPSCVFSSATLRIALDRHGRRGKQATIIYGFPPEMPEADIAALAMRLKQRLGVGGSTRGGEILIQGDKRQPLAELLHTEGYNTKII